MDHGAVSPTVLIAPLDWGLGHATRCIPIIRECLAQNARVVIAASGKVKALLQLEFPHLRYLHLPGYNITYAAKGWELPFKIVAQIPKLISAIKSEQRWLKALLKQEAIDVVISDNRYGLYHPGVRCIFLTHQLKIKAPFKWIELLLQKINYSYINTFDECWVPDAPGNDNLAGELSHPPQLPAIPVKYLGPLSRFSNSTPGSTQGYLLLMLSGPEPQRSLLEEILLAQIHTYNGPVVIVRGKPAEELVLNLPQNITAYNHVNASDLERLIKGASMVIARSGYSTVMDLMALRKKSILIPTPGQTEQVYLAKELMKNNLAFCIAQNRLGLTQALQLAASFKYKQASIFQTVLPQELKRVLQELIAKRKDMQS